MQLPAAIAKFPGSMSHPAVPATSAAEDLRGWQVIGPRGPLLDLQLRELWQYRDLIFLLFRRDFVATYKQTVLGPIWFFAQPVMTSLVFWVVFGRVGKIVTKGVPQFLFFMGGIILWNFFSACFLRTAGTFTQNSALFTKVYFPRLAVPLSGVLTNLVIFATQFVCFCLFFFLSSYLGVTVVPNWRVIFLPLLLIDAGVFALGTGLIIAALTTRFRDLAIAVNFGVQLLMYASCVVFPLSAIDPDRRWLFTLNPMVPVIEAFRLAFLDSGVVEPAQLVVSALVSLVFLVVGLLMFRRVEAIAMDTI